MRLFFPLLFAVSGACSVANGPLDPPFDLDKADATACTLDGQYVADSPQACAAIRFTCAEGEEAFWDACGCGCVPAPTCPTNRQVIEADPDRCAVIRFTCEEDETPFSDACGCGCTLAASTCPNPSDPGVFLVSSDPDRCSALRFQCALGETGFSGACGCGCVMEPPAPSVSSMAGAEEQEPITQKMYLDVAAVHDAGHVAFTDRFPYPGDIAMPAALRAAPFHVPFALGTWVRVQQGNNTMNYHREGGATHGPDKILRYALDLNLGGDDAGVEVQAAGPGRAFVYDGARPLGVGEYDEDRARDNGGLGNFVAIVHGNGYASLYAHLDNISVATGVLVAAGDPIGTIGRTGGAGAIGHLHFYVASLLRIPMPGVVVATDHAAFAAEYNRTFGVSVPFAMHAGFLEAHGERMEVVDSRLLVSDYYGFDPFALRPESAYWIRRVDLGTTTE